MILQRHKRGAVQPFDTVNTSPTGNVKLHHGKEHQRQTELASCGQGISQGVTEPHKCCRISSTYRSRNPRLSACTSDCAACSLSGCHFYDKDWQKTGVTVSEISSQSNPFQQVQADEKCKHSLHTKSCACLTLPQYTVSDCSWNCNRSQSAVKLSRTNQSSCMSERKVKIQLTASSSENCQWFLPVESPELQHTCSCRDLPILPYRTPADHPRLCRCFNSVSDWCRGADCDSDEINVGNWRRPRCPTREESTQTDGDVDDVQTRESGTNHLYLTVKEYNDETHSTSGKEFENIKIGNECSKESKTVKDDFQDIKIAKEYSQESKSLKDGSQDVKIVKEDPQISIISKDCFQNFKISKPDFQEFESATEDYQGFENAKVDSGDIKTGNQNSERSNKGCGRNVRWNLENNENLRTSRYFSIDQHLSDQKCTSRLRHQRGKRHRHTQNRKWALHQQLNSVNRESKANSNPNIVDKGHRRDNSEKTVTDKWSCENNESCSDYKTYGSGKVENTQNLKSQTASTCVNPCHCINHTRPECGNNSDTESFCNDTSGKNQRYNDRPCCATTEKCLDKCGSGSDVKQDCQFEHKTQELYTTCEANENKSIASSHQCTDKDVFNPRNDNVITNDDCIPLCHRQLWCFKWLRSRGDKYKVSPVTMDTHLLNSPGILLAWRSDR